MNRTLNPRTAIIVVLALLSGMISHPVAVRGQTPADTVHSILPSLDSLNLDAEACILINRWQGSAAWLNEPMRLLSSTASYVTLGLPGAVTTYGSLRRDNGIVIAGASLLISELVAEGIGEGIKYLVGRKRPYQVYRNYCISPDTTETAPSFPSGHAIAVWTIVTSLSLNYPKWYVIAPTAIYAIMTSLSRPFLGVHYPSDIIAGAVLGFLTSYAFHQWVQPHWFPPR